MNKLVSPTQVSFVPGRQIVDNIIIFQEILHKFKGAKAKGKKGFMAWKVDLAEVYDRLQWDFVRAAMQGIGICGKFLDLLMSCVSTVQLQALVNDDLILFGEASPKQAKIMRKCIDYFCQMSGQLNRGGLGLKTEHVNQALLAKTGWRLVKKDNSLWAQALEQGLAWQWAKDQVKVDRFLHVNGWQLDQLTGLFTQAILNNIIGIHAMKDGDIKDKIRWGFTTDGKFLVNSAYHNITDKFDPMDWRWSFLWKISAPPKVLWKILVRWQLPPEGKYKLNTDGCRSKDSAIGAGAVVRDYFGTWLGGFSTNMGFGQVFQAELWAIYHGIILACQKEWFPLDIESDSQIAVQMLSSELEEEHPYYSLMEALATYISPNWVHPDIPTPFTHRCDARHGSTSPPRFGSALLWQMKWGWVVGFRLSSDDCKMHYCMSLCHQDAQLLSSSFEDHIGPQVLSALNLQQVSNGL
ncbi:hypothetical protein L3X38_004755 [Prunus dulcis]|uniref:RNase H type-1 domain-containing protein n=1 Tax=Prunus dulcis TaxID=3755 RepID=A0AAD4ZPM2_PRUDU|nr:hypothetical protein L3X38_004755 [Prunus dulcis]